MSEGNRFLVVAFDEENEVSVVPESWVSVSNGGTHCYWPSYKSTSKVTKSIQNMVDPEETWNKYQARVLTKCGKCLITIV